MMLGWVFSVLLLCCVILYVILSQWLYTNQCNLTYLLCCLVVT